MKIRIIKILFINLIIFIFILTGLEILARLFFKELTNETHSPPSTRNKTGLTRGIVTHQGKFNNFILERAPKSNTFINSSKNLFSIIGDSISFGYGTAYQDIYWSRLQRKYNLDKKNKLPLTFITLGGSGNNLNDAINQLKNFTSVNKDIKHKYIFYQFNYNDIVPYSKKEIKEIAENKDIYPGFTGFKMKYLFKSNLIRSLSINSKRILSKTNKKCADRGLNAMGGYTWSFGHPAYREEAINMWRIFEDNLIFLNKFAKENDAELLIFVSPILFDIDINGVHKYYNKNNLDFTCATINPLKKANNRIPKVT